MFQTNSGTVYQSLTYTGTVYQSLTYKKRVAETKHLARVWISLCLFCLINNEWQLYLMYAFFLLEG